jgi:hypothetical protein
VKTGCVALAAAPLLVVGAPFAALLRRAAVRRRGSAIRIRLSRTRSGGIPGLALLVDAPWARLDELATAMARTAAEVAAGIGLHVGFAIGHDGEEPALFTLAPRRDLVADRFRRVMLAGPAHAAPSLWLALSPGTYLATVIDPYAPAELGGERAAAAVAGGRCTLAVAVRRSDGTDSVVAGIEVYGSRDGLREFVRQSRAALSGLPDRERARNAPPPTPKTTLKRRLQE